MDGKTPRRFGMTQTPKPGGQVGSHEEAQAQWFLELSFFRDALFRNPPGKGGKGELADAVVLHDDVVLMVQVKAQSSARDPQVWAKSAIADALKQLGYTHRMLVDGHVRTLKSDTLGDLSFDPKVYCNRWGLIILDQDAAAFEALDLVPELADAAFPVQVYSLADFRLIAERFDTAGDLVNYIEMRQTFLEKLQPRVHEEAQTLRLVLERVPDYFRLMVPNMPEDQLRRTVEAVRRTALGEFLQRPYVNYGRAYDDIIARLHDADPALPENFSTKPSDILPIIEALGWLTRARRVALGERLGSLYAEAQDGADHFFCHFQRPRGAVFVYLASSASRSERAALLSALVLRAQAKHDCRIAVGVASEPLGEGRSYDACIRSEPLPRELLATLLSTDDPFGDTGGQLTP